MNGIKMQIKKDEIVLVFLTAALLILFFVIPPLLMTKTANKTMGINLVHDSEGTMGISNGVITGNLNVSMDKTENHVAGLWTIQMHFDSNYYYNNMSYALNLDYDLWDGRYILNQSISIKMKIADYQQTYQSSIGPGVLAITPFLNDFNITYVSPVGQQQLVLIYWAYSLSTEDNSVGSFSCALSINMSIAQSSGGLSSAQTRITSASILLPCSLVAIEAIRRHRKSRPENQKLAIRHNGARGSDASVANESCAA